MRLTILTDEAPVLRKKARAVRRITASTRRLIDDMIETMYAADGVGLAAPQIGVSRQIIVVDAGDGVQEIINPQILSTEGTECALEGCLSVPGWVGEVERAESVRVTGLDREGRQVWVDGNGLLARALQHEIDHLNGVLFTDRAISLMEAESRPSRLGIVYMGTPEFAVPPLDALVEAGHDVKLVVTQPDRKGNRGRVRFSAVKEFAIEKELRLEQPTNVNAPEFIAMLGDLEPGVIVVAAYGQKLSEELLAVAPHGGINIHASLLPRFRGASPIQRALMAGDRRTGITIMQMSPKIDAGNILSQAEVEISADHDAGTLMKELSEVGALELLRTLEAIAEDRAEPCEQPDQGVSYAPMLGAKDEIIDWGLSAETVQNLVRALSPEPGSRSDCDGRLVKIWKANAVSERPSDVRAGQVFVSDDGRWLIACGEGSLQPLDVQPAGKRRMSWDEFVRGYRPKQFC